MSNTRRHRMDLTYLPVSLEHPRSRPGMHLDWQLHSSLIRIDTASKIWSTLSRPDSSLPLRISTCIPIGYSLARLILSKSMPDTTSKT